MSDYVPSHPDFHEIIAAIDLGTNSCRLLIAKIEGYRFKVIDSFSRVVRLGEGIHTTNQLTSGAIERTLEALKICKQKITLNHATIIRAVTTEACRRAENSHELLNRISSELGIEMEIITSAEEARLALSGCAGIISPYLPYAIAFDIGGGSTEVMWLRTCEPRRIHRRRTLNLEVLDYVSLPFGVVTLSDAYGNNAYSSDVYNEIRYKTSEKLQNFSKRNNITKFLELRKVQMVGTSGTVTTLAAIKQGLQRYDRRLIDGFYIQIADIHNVSQQVLHMTPPERLAHPCIGPGRSDLVVMGTAILEGICDVWPVNKLRVADRGVREGILMDLTRHLRGRKTQKGFVQSS